MESDRNPSAKLRRSEERAHELAGMIAKECDRGVIHVPWNRHVPERALELAGMIAGARDRGIIQVP